MNTGQCIHGRVEQSAYRQQLSWLCGAASGLFAVSRRATPSLQARLLDTLTLRRSLSPDMIPEP